MHIEVLIPEISESIRKNTVSTFNLTILHILLIFEGLSEYLKYEISIKYFSSQKKISKAKHEVRVLIAC